MYESIVKIFSAVWNPYILRLQLAHFIQVALMGLLSNKSRERLQVYNTENAIQPDHSSCCNKMLRELDTKQLITREGWIIQDIINCNKCFAIKKKIFEQAAQVTDGVFSLCKTIH